MHGELLRLQAIDHFDPFRIRAENPLASHVARAPDDPPSPRVAESEGAAAVSLHVTMTRMLNPRARTNSAVAITNTRVRIEAAKTSTRSPATLSIH